MAPKLELEKLAWQWVETTTAENVTVSHVETAYRLNIKRCQFGSCRRNCKGNPHCFDGLGEKGWLGEIDELNWVELEDPNNERRLKDSFVGLKNLGATCYVNSLLQLWFHNTAFRQAIYHYKPELEEQEELMTDVPTEPVQDYYPKSVIGQLQYIFALLQFSNRRYIDTSGFIGRLGLNTAEQQDAQEFSKLFMSLLEDKLKHQHNTKVKNVIQQQFQGQYEYCTKCSNCSVVSARPSEFYELDLNIKGNKDLYGCIEEFVKEEKLEGSDQYYCSICNSKQDATRKIQLKHLPVVLNFQLLRFIYDRQSSQKKKLNTCIRFPEMLNMQRCLDMSDESAAVYDLSAVLIHRGSSAYSGHYIALIKDRSSGLWYRFNDESIEKIDEKSLKSGIEEDSDSSSSKPVKSRTPKGFYSTTNAYMLVYQRRNSDAEVAPADLSVEWDVPEKLQEAVAKDNSKFEEWVAEMNLMREQSASFSRERQIEIKEFYNQLQVASSEEEWEWIPTEWLIKWLGSDQHIPPINNMHDLCPHHRLHPNVLINSKYIPKTVADKLFKKYGGGPRLGREVHCQDCVISECRQLQWKLKLQEDCKLISNLLKAKPSSEETSSFWVGKASLRCWRKLALQQKLEHLEGGNYAVSSSLNSCTDLTDRPARDTGFSGMGGSNENDAEDIAYDYPVSGFNDDLLCEHGRLRVEENSRRLIVPDAWVKLKFYFPCAPEFQCMDPICNECEAQSTRVLQTIDVHRKIAAEQKIHLQNLYLDRNRPPNSLDIGYTKLYILNNQFIESWKKFVKDPMRRSPVVEVSNAVLLCQHNSLMYPPCFDKSGNASDMFTLVWDSEWKIITSFFKVDHEIVVVVDKPEKIGDAPSFTCNPEVCMPCYETVLKNEQDRQLDYGHATIYVCRVPSASDMRTLSDPLINNINEDGPGKEDSDPEFVQSGNSSKRRRRNSRATSWNVSPPGLQVRRSTRHRKGRDAKPFVVSSQHTLRDLKLQIMKHFCVAPYDQHLSLNGRELTSSQATLRELGILPNSVIYLMADEPCEEAASEDVVSLEEGFKGTELVRR